MLKIQWDADAKTKLITREIEPADDQIALNTLTREKTNIVICNQQEKERLQTHLDAVLRRNPASTMWLTPSHIRSFERVRDELNECI